MEGRDWRGSSIPIGTVVRKKTLFFVIALVKTTAIDNILNLAPLNRNG